MKNTDALKSGKTYNLSQIFSPEFKIAIPDLQRDYCWGLETYNDKGNKQGELVLGFLSSLKKIWEDCKDCNELIPMGLIYGYEWPKGTYQLCDGQQRITTFYLLTGELYKKVSDPNVKKLLYAVLTKYSTQEADSTVEVSLQYSIRESTLYFISDLVKNYFLNDKAKDLSLNSDENRDKEHLMLKLQGRPAWYFLEYDNDPSIQAMLGALRTIKKFINTEFSQHNIDAFAKAIVTKFSFIYYDMGNRLRGEETFVVLNTTGEPLTPTENLKPILIGNLAYTELNESKQINEISKQWEEREDWFWKNKLDSELTSDGFSRDFYTWWIMAHCEKESVNLIKDYLNQRETTIQEVHKFYNALVSITQWLLNYEDALSILKTLSNWTPSNDKTDFCDSHKLISWFRSTSRIEILLPLVLFKEKFGDDQLLFSFYRRIVKNFYIGQTTKGEKDNEYRPYVKLVDIFKIINSSTSSSDVLKYKSWYNRDEQRKDEVFRNNLTGWYQLEQDEHLRFDLNVIWDAGASTYEEANAIRNTLHTLHKLAQGDISDMPDDSEAIAMSNYYRLVKFIMRWGTPVGKQWQVNWKQWGVYFNFDSYDTNLNTSYRDSDMWELLKTNDLKNELHRILKKKISPDIFFEKNLHQPDNIMTAWLTAKVLVNEPQKQLITNYSDYPLCIDKEMEANNLINKELPTSMGNMCLHHANRTGPWNINSQNYIKSICLDSPLYVDFLDIDHSRFTKGQITAEEITSFNNQLDKLLFSFLEDNI